MKRTVTIMISILALALFTVGCAADGASSATVTPAMTTEAAAATDAAASDSAVVGSAADGTLELTLDQLKQYDGKNGNPAYVAVDGILYDVTNDNNWKNGSHKGYSAGYDLTEQIEGKSPHGTSVLDGVPIVGKLVAG